MKNTTTQQSLFETATTDNLAIRSIAQKGVLSKAQQDFNHLTDLISKKQNEIVKKESEYDELLRLYSTKILPLKNKLKILSRNYLIEIYNSKNDLDKKLKKSEKANLEQILSILIEEYTDLDDIGDLEKDIELKQIIEDIEDCDIDEMINEEKENQVEAMKFMLAQMGIKIDLKEFGSSPNEIFENLDKIRERILILQDQNNSTYTAFESEKFATAKKSKKQLEKEARQKEIIDAKNKNISTIYKQLAKVLHPDLEQDPIKKLEKEDIMKEVVSAYNDKNLHKLLQLELKWIQQEKDNLTTLTDEKLRIYNQILKEQVDELQNQLHEIEHNPRYLMLYQYADRSFKNSTKKLLDDTIFLNYSLESTEEKLEMMKIDSLTHLKTIAKL